MKKKDQQTVVHKSYFAAEKRFENQCRLACSAQDLHAIINVFETTLKSKHSDTELETSSMDYAAKKIYNKYIGWALPTDHVCDLIVNFQKTTPLSKIVDMGAGSGFLCLLLQEKGIPKTQLIAVDRHHPPANFVTKNQFWPVHRDDYFEVHPNDILLIAWGYAGIVDRLNDYVERGGQFVIIIGETTGGCTLPWDFFCNDDDWLTSAVHIQGPASDLEERISFSVRKK